MLRDLLWHFNDGFVDFPVDHPVFLERAIVLSAVLECEDTVAVFEILSPFTLVLGTIGVVKRTFAMSEAIEPVAHVAIAKELVIR